MHDYSMGLSDDEGSGASKDGIPAARRSGTPPIAHDESASVPDNSNNDGAESGKQETVPPSAAPPAATSKGMDRSTAVPSAKPSSKPPSKPSSVNTPITEEPALSHPMTATTSNSSHNSSKEASSSGKGAPQYGTRSRNKPRATRPNYAEDVEMDFELPINVTVGGKKNSRKEPSVSHSPPADTSPQSPAPTKRAAAAAANGWNTININSSTIPGTSTFSANPNVNVKKRKVAINSGNSQNQTQPAQTHPSSRRSHASAPSKETRERNMFSFSKSQAKLKNGKLIADDGTVFSVNDHVYLVCEPPGEPYYLGRIMEFRTKNTDDATTPVDGLRINWVYRPRDVQRMSNDTRLVYATMHSDVCPLTSLRGRCYILHRSEFEDQEEFRKKPDHFYFTQVFDRFIHRWYEVVPTSQVVNVPEKVKKALDDRWKYVVVEASKVKELTSAVKLCKRCVGYCAGHDSVECAVCHNTYHMNCVRPPLLKKPSRGFAWACAPCSRAQERRLEARRTPIVGDNTPDADDEEIPEEDEEDPAGVQTTAGSPQAIEDRPATEAEIAHAKMWTMRYLGVHCRVEDALQYDDRAIYPRASSRLGPKHQCTVLPWYGRPVKLVKPIEIKKKYIKSAGYKKDTKLSKETLAALEADKVEKAKRPLWVQDEPVGYVRRGEDHPNKDPSNTAKLVFQLPTLGELSERGREDAPAAVSEDVVDAYMKRAKKIAQDIGVHHYSVDFLDRAVYLLQENNFNADVAIERLKKTDPIGKWPKSRLEIRQDLRDPRFVLSRDEQKRFDDGVSKFGSELRTVRMHVKSVSHADIVRYWYHWKKTSRGREIWGTFGGRKNTKKVKAESDNASKLLDDIADAQDDSAFDNDKIEQRTRKLICKHCSRRHSRIWRRAPGVTPGQTVQGDGKSSSKKDGLVLALCDRCARLWRRYAIKWENMDEIAKKVAQGGGRAWKKKVDEELLREWEKLNKEPPQDIADAVELDPSTQAGAEPAKKKIRVSDVAPEPKKKAVVQQPPPPPRIPTPPLVPQWPKMASYPCAICQTGSGESDCLICRDCRLTVHAKCYGEPDLRNGKFTCDMCSNDRKESATVAGASADPASYAYNCVLCPVHLTQCDLVEAPTISHHKKNSRQKEKERVEKQLAAQLTEQYRQQQKDRGRPSLPREALKRTLDNNWIHLTCALFIPDIKFSDAKVLDGAEGVPFARQWRTWDCKFCQTTDGASITCHASHCNTTFHVACALKAGCAFGIQLQPVKGNRRDSSSSGVATLKGQTGIIEAAIYCDSHKSQADKDKIWHLETAADDQGTTVLQVFAEKAKQADLTLTGTARKANQLDDFTKFIAMSAPKLTENRRISASGPSKVKSTKDVKDAPVGSITGVPIEHPSVDFQRNTPPKEKETTCFKCGIDVSPKWWKADNRSVALGRLSSAQDDNHGSNGIKRESQPSRESSMRVESGQLSNGLGAHSNHSTEPYATEAVERTGGALECNRCHWNTLNALSESKTTDIEMTVDTPPPSPPVLSNSAVRPLPIQPIQPAPPVQAVQSVQPVPAVQPGPRPWTPLANISVQPPTHGTWPPVPPTAYNGVAPPPPYNGVTHTSPQLSPYMSHHQQGYRPNPSQVPLGTYGLQPPQDGPHGGYGLPPPPPPPQGVGSHGYHAPMSQPMHSSLHGMPNGIHHHSPTRPHPPPLPRQTESPFAAQPLLNQYSHHHSSPVAHHGSPVIGGHSLPGSGGHSAPLAPTRSAHGASASPSVRNLLDD